MVSRLGSLGNSSRRFLLAKRATMADIRLPNVELVKSKLSYVKSFAEETPLHGFNIASRSCSKVDAAVWMILVAICSVMAVQQTVQLIQLYQSEPTTTSVTLHNREALQLDSVVLCVPFSNQIFDIPLNLTVDQLANLLGTVNVTDLRQIHTEHHYVPHIELQLLTYLIEMFSRISEVEFALASDQIFEETILWGLKNSSLSQVLSHLHSFIRQQNISLEALLKVTVSTICQRMNMWVTTKRAMESNEQVEIRIHVCSPTNILFFDSSQFSVAISSTETPVVFESLQDQLIINFNLSAVYNSPISKHFPFVPKYYVLFDGKAYQDAQMKSGGNFISNNIETKICTAIRLRTAYKFFNTRRNPCSEVESGFVCQNLCWASLVAKNCNCWPISAFPWKPTDSKLSICTERPYPTNKTIQIPDFNNCSQMELYKRILKCQRDCIDDCWHRDYDFTRENTDTFIMCDSQFGINYTADMSTSLLLFTNVFSYSYIEESPSKNVHTFLNEFGGLVGVWLGGSLLAFVHIPLFWLKALLTYTRSKPKETTQGSTKV